MKNGLLITSVLVILFFYATPGLSQSTAGRMPQSTTAAKCVGSSDCTACKNCSSCAHCKDDGGKCGVCKKNASHHAASTQQDEEDYTKVEWSAKSLKPGATTLQSLEVHSGPGESFKVVGKVTNRDPLIIIGEREGWYKIVVSHADLVGFVEVSNVSIAQ
ncbi:SH3 domain-containing protein [Chryseolinea sp. T2]|uniref:SH3 domain-containing protein n=1 Tax=Chryseolinea sp. T2 TaxID=3129255 RepID=UPI0030777520